MAKLAAQGAQQTYARRWVAYAYGRDRNPLDDCVVRLPPTSVDPVPDRGPVGRADAVESFRVRVRDETP